MPQVQTVTGPVDTAALGQVLMHEHVFVLTPVAARAVSLATASATRSSSLPHSSG